MGSRLFSSGIGRSYFQSSTGDISKFSEQVPFSIMYNAPKCWLFTHYNCLLHDFIFHSHCFLVYKCILGLKTILLFVRSKRQRSFYQHLKDQIAFSCFFLNHSICQAYAFFHPFLELNVSMPFFPLLLANNSFLFSTKHTYKLEKHIVTENTLH